MFFQCVTEGPHLPTPQQLGATHLQGLHGRNTKVGGSLASGVLLLVRRHSRRGLVGAGCSDCFFAASPAGGFPAGCWDSGHAMPAGVAGPLAPGA